MRPPIKPESSGVAQFVRQHWSFLAILAALSFLPLSFPMFSCGLIEHDEGMYVLVAEIMHQGGVLYRDVYDNKLPLLHALDYLVVGACGTSMGCIRGISLALNFLIAAIIFATSAQRMGGIYKYLPPLIYIFFALFLGLNAFLRAELFTILFWAASFHFLISSMDERRPRPIFLACFFAALPLFIKPLSAAALALPILYAIAKSGNPRESALWASAGFLSAAIPLLAISFLFLNLSGFPAQANGWSVAEFIEYFSSFSWMLSAPIYGVLSFLFLAPALPFMMKKEKGHFEGAVLLLFLSTIVLFLSRAFSFHFYVLVLSYYLLPASFAWTLSISELAPAARKCSQKAGIRELLGSVALPASAIFFPLLAMMLLLPSFAASHFSTNNHVSFCGSNGEMIQYLKEHSEGSFFVFPSRGAYYTILGKEPFMPLIFQHSDSGFPKSREWFEEKVMRPVEDGMPDHVLFFQSDFDLSSFSPASLSEFKSFLDSNYSPVYFNVSNSTVVYYSRG